ncbi:hypothetical protein [Serinicoccus sp. LYQ131]|uniref:hypothetical protein n=2 Tax=unclassified Serinicoccus TaxID=2643101 RepID=UPI003852A1A2
MSSTAAAPASPSAPAQVVEDEPDPSTPTTEDIGETEEPAPVQDAGVSILLAGLPVGGFAEVSLDDPFLRCVHVNWTGEVDLPPGVGLELSEIDLHPAGVYEAVDSGCPGDLPGCLHRPGVLERPGLCGVPVRQLGPSSDGVGSLGVVAGRVTCTSEEGWRCAEFQAQLVAADDPQRIRWDDAVVEQPEAETQTGTGSTDTSATTQDG